MTENEYAELIRRADEAKRIRETIAWFRNIANQMPGYRAGDSHWADGLLQNVTGREDKSAFNSVVSAACYAYAEKLEKEFEALA
jgi:hypothetical protein